MTVESIRFALYGRVYCHLCNDMAEALERLLAEAAPDRKAVVDVIDIDEDEQLEARFGERIPVLVAGNSELCHYFLDEAAVRAYLANIR